MRAFRINFENAVEAMNTKTTKNILLIAISGFLFSGCYTQLGSLEKESEQGVAEDGYEKVDSDQDYRYGYHNVFGAYDNFYYPYFLYSGGYFFGSYFSPFGFAPYYGYGYGYNGLTYYPGVVSQEKNNNQIRSSGLYASGDRGERRSRGDNGSNTRSRLSDTNDNNRVASRLDSDQTRRTSASRESSKEMLRSRSSAIRSNQTYSEEEKGDRIKRGAVQSRGRNFTYRTKNVRQTESDLSSKFNTSIRNRSNSKSFANRRTVDGESRKRDRGYTSNDLRIITSRHFSTASNAETATSANLSILYKNVRLVESMPLSTRRGIQRSFSAGYFKNTSWYTRFENSPNPARSIDFARNGGVRQGHNVHTGRSYGSRSRSSLNGRSSGIRSGSSGRSSGSSVTRSRSSSNSRGSRSGSSSSGSRSSGSNNQRSSGSN